MPRISQLPSLSAADNADEIAIVDVSASTTKKITRGDLLKAPLPANSVTTAAIANASITESKLNLTTLGFGNYSTTEVNTGFTWVDGSPIYKKSVAFGALPNNTNKNVPHGISGLNKVINVEANQYEGVNRSAFPFTHGATLNFQQQILIDATDIKIYTYSNRTGVTIDYITLYYTKS